MKGVVIKTFPYQDTGKIVHIYTLEVGLISLLVKRISEKNIHLRNVLSPLSQSDFQITKKKSDLYHYQDATLIDPYLELRRDFDKLEVGGEMAQLILKTQTHARPTPPLYTLLTSFLHALKTTEQPRNYLVAFMLKLMRVEGIFPLEKEDFPIEISEKEWEDFSQLAYATSHDVIAEVTLPTQAHKIIVKLKDELFTLL